MKKIVKKISVISIIWCVLLGTSVFATSNAPSNTTNNTTKNSEGGVTTILNSIENVGASNIWVIDNATRETNSAPSNTTENVISEGTTSQLLEMKEKELKSLEDYQKKYGSDTYGLTAYVLNRVRVFSIPFCFLGIALSAIYQYVLGIRKLDTRDKGFGLMISIVTIFVICQVLPLVFALVVKGWRG